MVIDDTDKEEIDTLKYTTYLNMSQIDLYNKNYEKANTRATNSLKIKPTSKGYFRRACARIELKQWDGAEDDLRKCLDLEPANKDAKEKMQLVKAKSKEVDNDLGNKLKKMFIS